MKKQLKDQYGNNIPRNLVLLDSYDMPDPYDIQTVLNDVDWYEANGIILVSYEQLRNHGIPDLETDPLDIDINVNTAKIVKIDDCLKRWSAEEGFSHA